MELSEILSRCDHTLLRTDAGSEEIRRLCDEAVKYGRSEERRVGKECRL